MLIDELIFRICFLTRKPFMKVNRKKDKIKWINNEKKKKKKLYLQNEKNQMKGGNLKTITKTKRKR